MLPDGIVMESGSDGGRSGVGVDIAVDKLKFLPFSYQDVVLVYEFQHF